MLIHHDYDVNKNLVFFFIEKRDVIYMTEIDNTKFFFKQMLSRCFVNVICVHIIELYRFYLKKYT